MNQGLRKGPQWGSRMLEVCPASLARILPSKVVVIRASLPCDWVEYIISLPLGANVGRSPAVVELLQEEESHHLAGLSDFIRKPISLMTEVGMGPEDYNIVLL